MPWQPKPLPKRQRRSPARVARSRRCLVAPFGGLVPSTSAFYFVWAGQSRLVFSGAPGSGIVGQLPNGPFAAGASIGITGQLVDALGNGIPAAQLSALTLSVVDLLSGQIVNGLDQVNILNTGRGTVDAQGNVTITLGPADTLTTEAPGRAQVARALILDWSYASGTVASTGRAQANFIVAALAGP